MVVASVADAAAAVPVPPPLLGGAVAVPISPPFVVAVDVASVDVAAVVVEAVVPYPTIVADVVGADVVVEASKSLDKAPDLIRSSHPQNQKAW